MPTVRAVMPQTRPGRWSVGFAIVSLSGLLLTPFIADRTGGGGDVISDNWAVAGTMLASIASAIIAALIGLVAAVKYHERSVVVNGIILLGLVTVLFVVGEFFGPQH